MTAKSPCPVCGTMTRPLGIVVDIQAAVAKYYRVPRRSMVSARRDREITRPRQIAMYLARELTPQSLPAIGSRFGGRDHTTVMHAIRAVQHLIATDGDIARDVEKLRARLAV
jgi:chromosomal replication initiator protein